MPHSDDFLAVHDPAAPSAAHPAHAPDSGNGRWWGFAVALAAGLLLLCALTWLVSVQRGLATLQQSTATRADRYAATFWDAAWRRDQAIDNVPYREHLARAWDTLTWGQ